METPLPPEESPSLPPEDNLPVMYLNNRAETVWIFGYVRLLLMIQFIVVPLGFIFLYSWTKITFLGLCCPLSLVVLYCIECSRLLNPISRILLADPLRVDWIVGSTTYQLSDIRKIIIAQREGLEYSEDVERYRQYTMTIQLPRRNLRMYIGKAGAQHLKRWCLRFNLPLDLQVNEDFEG